MNEAPVAPPLLQARGLSKFYETKRGLFGKADYIRAVDGVDLDVYEGETLGIVGESGCGKSTVGQMLLQLLPPTAGEIRFGGQLLTGLPPDKLHAVRRDMQIVFQDPYSSLNPRMKIGDTIAEPLRIHRTVPRADIRREVAGLLEAVGLGEHHMSRYPHEFSGGQRQRIGIARALALKPKLIVCDEAVSALDVSIQAQILNLLKKLQREYRLTYVFISHGMPAVKHISDRVAVMYLGKIVEIAERDKLFAHPRHPYTEALLASLPASHPGERKERVIVQGEVGDSVAAVPGCPFQARCPYARDLCRQTAPVLTEEAGHAVACHFPL
ncbi:ABC transporter ATP-binding protein [Paenibacillus hodogayensis]|uniref:ABC transporter ATP-binding protein n=1 Tax=Paenibacillus hodogayensis TaxID=279208 RepID=A0ABV5W755_9BACL